MAFELTDTTPFPSFSFGNLDTDRRGFTFAPEKTDLSLDISSLELSDSVLNKAGMFDPYLPNTNVAAPDRTANLLADYLGGLKAKAGKEQFYGATLKGIAAAGNLFNSILSYTMGRSIADKQARNAKMSAENKMKALDNQVLYQKNQIADKFNTLLARNTVTMAAKNLRVSAGALLEQTKDAAYDATKDIETLESNARLKKIALRNEEKQTKITSKLAKTQLATNLVGSLAQAGLVIGSGGGTMKSWGDLYAGFESAKEYDALKNAMQSGSFNDLY